MNQSLNTRIRDIEELTAFSLSLNDASSPDNSLPYDLSCVDAK